MKFPCVPTSTLMAAGLFAIDFSFVRSFTAAPSQLPGRRQQQQQQQRRQSISTVALHATSDESSSADLVVDPSNVGLYRRFSDHARERLQESGLFESIDDDDDDVPSRLKLNQATQTRGGKSSLVQIQNFAMRPAEGCDDIVRYTRVALLETIDLSDTNAPGSEEEPVTHTEGIQVLNFIIVPSSKTDLPVLGIDLVRLPGDKNLLLLDAQPMADPNPYQDLWKEWYTNHVEGDSPVFSWGGDFPPPVQQYVSPYALWTRLQPPAEDMQETWDPTSITQNELWNAFTSHLDIYLELLKEQKQQEGGEVKSNNQAGYLEYRRTTDPAKPMLNALFGPEWTQEALDQVLFPTWMD